MDNNQYGSEISIKLYLSDSFGYIIQVLNIQQIQPRIFEYCRIFVLSNYLASVTTLKVGSSNSYENLYGVKKCSMAKFG